MEKEMTNEEGRRLLIARKYREDFEPGSTSYSGLIKASDGKIYFIISYDRQGIDDNAQMYYLYPATEKIQHIADIGEVVGEKGKKFVGQGKTHTGLWEHKGKLFLTTHFGYYAPRPNSMAIEAVSPILPAGYKPSRGRILSYDLRSGKFEELVQAPVNEGFLASSMDSTRERLYALTWPPGYLFRYDLSTNTSTNLGSVYGGKGEAGKKDEYERICRTLAINPQNGMVYWSKGTGKIGRYNPDTNVVDIVAGCDLNLKTFGSFDSSWFWGDEQLEKGNIWRTILWYPREKRFYGLHWRLEYLFRFDPEAERVEAVHSFCAKDSLYRGGASLAFALGPDGETLYHITEGPGFEINKGNEIPRTLHLLTYHIPTGKYIDHGAIVTDDGCYPYRTQSLVLSPEGTIYTIAWFPPRGNIRQVVNLISFSDPTSS